MKKISSTLVLYLVAAFSAITNAASARFGTHEQLQSQQQQEEEEHLNVPASSITTTTSCNSAAAECGYTVVVQTGSKHQRPCLAGTAHRGPPRPPTIHDLEAWGTMSDGHDYFERGSLDVFEGRAECMRSEPCWMMLASDGSGVAADWYVTYVEVDVYPGAEGTQYKYINHKFAVNQWIDADFSALRDECYNHAAMA